MYSVAKKDTNGSAFYFWIRPNTAYVLKNDFSNLSGFPRESLCKMISAIGWEGSTDECSIDELCKIIKDNIVFE